MAEINVHIYIAVVLAFTFIPIQGGNVTCRYNDSVLVSENCYRVNNDYLYWTEARDNCVKWNGTLATLTSLDHLKEVYTALGNPNTGFWVDALIEAGKTEFYIAAFSNDMKYFFQVLSSNCTYYNPSKSICAENNNMSVNDLTSKSRNKSKTQIDLKTKTIKNVTCLHNDSVPVDGQCFRLSTEEFTWSNASNYCNSWNGTLATILSMEQGIKVLTAMNISNNDIWITDSSKSDKAKSLLLRDNGMCTEFYYARDYLFDDTSHKVLCNEMPITNSESNRIPMSTTTPKLINKPDTTTNPETTTKPEKNRRPESITASESITTIPAQDKNVNRNLLLHLNLLHSHSIDPLRDHTRILTRFGYYTNDLN